MKMKTIFACIAIFASMNAFAWDSSYRNDANLTTNRDYYGNINTTGRVGGQDYSSTTSRDYYGNDNTTGRVGNQSFNCTSSRDYYGNVITNCH